MVGSASSVGTKSMHYYLRSMLQSLKNIVVTTFNCHGTHTRTLFLALLGPY